MTDISGEKLITAAYLFGTAAVVFTLLPFLGVIVAGIVKGNQGGNHNKNSDIVSIVVWALVVHCLVTFLFMGLILILDKMNLDTPNYYTSKIFPIFWAETKEQVYSLAGVTDTGDILSGVAYSTLHLIQTMTRLFYLVLPIIVFVLAFVYGVVLSNKDNYENNNFVNLATYTSISFVIVSLLYLFWAKISSFAIFMPNGMNIVDMVSSMWTNIFKI